MKQSLSETIANVLCGVGVLLFVLFVLGLAWMVVTGPQRNLEELQARYGNTCVLPQNGDTHRVYCTDRATGQQWTCGLMGSAPDCDLIPSPTAPVATEKP